MAFSTDAPQVASVKPGSLQALWLKYQAFLFFPVTSFLVGLGWTLFLHPKHAARTSRPVELASMAARYTVFYLSFAPKCVLFFGLAAHTSHTSHTRRCEQRTRKSWRGWIHSRMRLEALCLHRSSRQENMCLAASLFAETIVWFSVSLTTDTSGR